MQKLSKELQKEFPGVGGFSVGDLWLMAQFYNDYQSDTNLTPMVREISWSKHIVILKKCKDLQERLFYTQATKKFDCVSTYSTTKSLPKEYKKLLPSAKEIEEKLKEFFES